MAIRLVAADLDGTLLNSQKTISPGTQRAITRAQAAGIHFAVSTGRMLCECGDILAALPQVRYISCSSGACVLGLANKATPEAQAIQALGLSHCRSTPWKNPGTPFSSRARRGSAVAMR